MNGRVINIFGDVVEVEFSKDNLFLVNYLLIIHDG